MWFQKPPLGTPLDWGNPLNDETVLALAMNEGHGDKLQDLSMNGNHGTLNNFAFPPTTASGWNPGQTGIGLNFDGIDDYVNCGAGVTNDPGAFTVSCLIKYGADPSTFSGMILSKFNFDLYSRSATTEIRFDTITTAGSKICQIPFSAFDYTEWNLITGVYDGTTADIYLNGNYVNGDPQTGNILDTSLYNFEIGKKPTSSLYFNGAIDQPRHMNRAWSAKEVRDYAINPWSVYLDEGGM